MSDSLQPHGQYPTRLRHPWESPGKNTGVGCHFLLQGIFPTQGSNLGLLHCRQTLYRLSHQGSPLKIYPRLCSTALSSRFHHVYDPSPGSAGKESACNVGDLGLIPGLGRSPGEGKGYPLQYFGLESSMDCIVHGVERVGHD